MTLKFNGVRLKQALRFRGLTQERAAELLGVSRQTVSSWLSRAELDEKTIQLVKLKLDIDLNEQDINLSRNHTQDLIDQLKERLIDQENMYKEIIEAKNDLIKILNKKSS